MRVIRLWLNPIKTQVMWLGCGQQLKHVDTAAEPDQDPRHVARLSTKTQVMWLGSGQQLKHVDINDITLLSTAVQVVRSARDLGVILDSRLTLSAHVAALCRSGYYQLRQLHPLVQSMTVEAAGWITAIRQNLCT